MASFFKFISLLNQQSSSLNIKKIVSFYSQRSTTSNHSHPSTFFISGQ